MIQSYLSRDGRFARAEPDDAGPEVIWMDLRDPSEDERAVVANWLGRALPTRQDMEEIELSSRLYHEDDTDYLTILIPAQVGEGHRDAVPVSFVLHGDRLVTMRHHEPRPFVTFPERADKLMFPCDRAEAVLVGLLEEIIDRIADILELTTTTLDGESRRMFTSGSRGRTRQSELLSLLGAITKSGDLVTDIRSCLLTLERALAFLGPILQRRGSSEDIRATLEVQKQDVRSLVEHAGFLSQKTNLMLDATLGAINIEQNANIKLFSIIAVVFLPPTLIASIYGMNFGVMPELGWPWGYPLAILAMVVSAVVPVTWFRHKGWM